MDITEANLQIALAAIAKLELANLYTVGFTMTLQKNYYSGARFKADKLIITFIFSEIFILTVKECNVFTTLVSH